MTTANNDERRGECAPAISIFCLHSREPEIYQKIATRDMDEMGIWVEMILMMAMTKII